MSLKNAWAGCNQLIHARINRRLPVVTLGEGLAEYADMLQHTATTAEASGALPSPAGQPASTAAAAAAAGGGAEGNRSGEGGGAQEREAAHRNIRHIKEACDLCFLFNLPPPSLASACVDMS
jgi:hypothetical protein